MKVIRSSICSLKFSTQEKRNQLRYVLAEYGRVTNLFIEKFWAMEERMTKDKLFASILNEPDTWLTARLRKVAAREAIDMINSSLNKADEQHQRIQEKILVCQHKGKKHDRYDAKLERIKPVMPTHRGNRMYVSVTIANLKTPKTSSEFDAWLEVRCLGQKIGLDLPIKFHKHYNKLAKRGERLNSYIITKDSVQFSFEVETGKKKESGVELGLDTGINALATLSDGTQYGKDIWKHLERILRCQHGSSGQKTARRALKQYIDEIAKQISSLDELKVLVVEKLRALNYQSKVKARLTKKMRASIGAWCYAYWLERIKMNCEQNRVSFRSVLPFYTSQKCNVCGYTDRSNRNGEIFLCLECNHKDNSDGNAAKNILQRWLTGAKKWSDSLLDTVPVANLSNVQFCADS